MPERFCREHETSYQRDRRTHNPDYATYYRVYARWNARRRRGKATEAERPRIVDGRLVCDPALLSPVRRGRQRQAPAQVQP